MSPIADRPSESSRLGAGGPAPTPFVSVIVPHYDDLAGLDGCLQRLERQTYPRESFEIIVADNASPQGEAEVTRVVAGRARLVVVHEKGAAPARNGGVAAATGEILAFTDSDCQPAQNWLSEGLAALASSDFVGGGVEVLVEDQSRMTSAEAFETVFAFDNRKYVLEKGFTVTANLFCRREHFDRTGGFRTGVSEDLDWSHRARDLGYKIGYAPDARVGHPARRTWPEVRKKWQRLGSETFMLYLGRPGGRIWWLVRSTALPFSALAHTPRVLASRRLSGLGQKLSALGILYRIRMWRFADALRLFVVGGRS